MSYCELHCCSAFSFLRGGSFPEQLAEVAAELEMPAIALLDRNGVYGAQRFSVAAREHGVRPIIGAEFEHSEKADSQHRLSLSKVRECRMHSPARYKRALPRNQQIALNC